jgi:hypothetical protein
VEQAKGGGKRQNQQEYNVVAIDCRPTGGERTNGLINGDSLDGVRPRR